MECQVKVMHNKGKQLDAQKTRASVADVIWFKTWKAKLLSESN